MTSTRQRVAITGVGVVNDAMRGGYAELGAYLAAPRSVVKRIGPTGSQRLAAELGDDALGDLVNEAEARRLSRVCRFTVAAARLALVDAGLVGTRDLGVIVGSEFGDLRSTMDFADGYLARGPSGLSALLFPNTVMNTMAAATAIAVQARECCLTLNAPTIAGELAVARGAAAIGSGRLTVALAGGVDQLDAIVQTTTAALGGADDARGEGACFLVLESLDAARARGARIIGEILGAAWRALPARPCDVGRGTHCRAIGAALDAAGVSPADLRWIHASASGDGPRDAWERALLDTALAPFRPATTALSLLLGRHAGAGALRVAAGSWTARSGLLPQAIEVPIDGAAIRMTRLPTGPGLVHGVARGGSQVAMIVGGDPER